MSTPKLTLDEKEIAVLKCIHDWQEGVFNHLGMGPKPSTGTYKVRPVPDLFVKAAMNGRIEDSELPGIIDNLLSTYQLIEVSASCEFPISRWRLPDGRTLSSHVEPMAKAEGFDCMTIRIDGRLIVGKGFPTNPEVAELWPAKVDCYRLTRDGLEYCRTSNGGGEPKRTYSIDDMLKLTGFKESKTLNKYATMANVPTPGRGEKNFRWTHDQAIAILTAVCNNGNRRDSEKSRASLNRLENGN